MVIFNSYVTNYQRVMAVNHELSYSGIYWKMSGKSRGFIDSDSMGLGYSWILHGVFHGFL